MTGKIVNNHLHILFQALSPEKIGEDYRAAIASGDTAGAVKACAAYYRAREAVGETLFVGEGTCDLTHASRIAAGAMREVNIDWTFPDGHIRYLFNPTEQHGPVNHEWLWQLNRHAFWQTLATAYRMTGEERYATAFCTQLLDWIEQTSEIPDPWNAPGSAWRTIECGIRLLGSWQTAFAVFRRAKAFTDEAMMLMLASMYRQAKHLLAHPTKNNWLMMESNGIYTFASLFPEFAEAEELRKEACRRLTQELAKQLLPDGFHEELSPDYHSVVFRNAFSPYSLAKLCGHTGDFSSEYAHLMELAADAYVDMSTPGFTQPRTNDTYTLQTSAVTTRAYDLFRKPAYLYVNSRRAQGEAPQGETASRFLPWAGFCVMRNDWSADSAYLCFDVGPLGSGHMHQDKLNINLYKGGEELIFDDGGGQYEISPARRYGISGYDHNVMLIDGMAEERAEPKRQSEPIDVSWHTDADFDYAKASYDDPYGEGRPAVHTREVRFCKPDFFCVYDRVTSSDGVAHTADMLLHIDTIKVDRVSAIEGALLSDIGRVWDILIVPLEQHPCEIVSAQTEPRYSGWHVGRNESVRHPASTVMFRSGQALTHTFCTLLFPVKRGEALPVITYDGDVITVDFRGRHTVIRRSSLSCVQ